MLTVPVGLGLELTNNRWLSGIKITDMDTLKQAITTLHETYRIPHIMISSISLPSEGVEPHLSVMGSTFTSTCTPRIFATRIPSIDCFFSGTGDMFAALTLVRLREAVIADGLLDTAAWVSDDSVEATELPLARAAEKVLASMQEVLAKTKVKRDDEMEKYRKGIGSVGRGDDKKRLKLMESKAAEVSLVRNVRSLKNPEVKYKAEKM